MQTIHKCYVLKLVRTTRPLKSHDSLRVSNCRPLELSLLALRQHRLHTNVIVRIAKQFSNRFAENISLFFNLTSFSIGPGKLATMFRYAEESNAKS